MKEAIILPRPLVQKLFAHAQLDMTAEICGLVSQTQDGALKNYPIPNVSDEPSHLFDMDSQAQIKVMTAMREKNESLFAIYHSHPSAPAEPSEKDQQALAYPEANYLIISLNTKGVLELRAWRKGDTAMQEVPLKILED